MQPTDRYLMMDDVHSTASNVTVEWEHNLDDSPLRLVRAETLEESPDHWRIEGHMDNNSTWARVEFRDLGADDRARQYLAAYLEADGFGRPASDAAHFPSVEVLTLSRQYQAAYLYGATTNSPDWVAFRLSTEDDDLQTETIYSYLSRVRSDYPELFD